MSGLSPAEARGDPQRARRRGGPAGTQELVTADAQLVDAVRAGDAAAAARALDDAPVLAEARAAGVPLVVLALYHGHRAVAEVIAARRSSLDVHELSALGLLAELRALLAQHPEEAGRAAADGHTPLGLAALFGHVEATRALLSAGADPRAATRNEQRLAPLHAAAARGAVAVARLLLDAGAEPDARQGRGRTALHAAAAAGQRAVAELLVERGADPTLLDGEGRTAADLARARGDAGLAEWLVGVGGG